MAGAVQAWLAGRKYPGQGLCDLSTLIAAIEPAAILLKGATPKTALSDLAWLIQTLPQADGHLRAGRGEEVRKLLYRNRHWQIATHHSHARLVQACLLREPRNGAEEFQWLLVMAFYEEMCSCRHRLIPSRPLPPAYRIDDTTMDALREEARKWLDR